MNKELEGGREEKDKIDCCAQKICARRRWQSEYDIVFHANTELRTCAAPQNLKYLTKKNPPTWPSTPSVAIPLEQLIADYKPSFHYGALCPHSVVTPQ